MTGFAVRGNVFRKALSDPDFCKKWNDCTSMADCEKVLADWCEAHGYVVKKGVKT